MTARALFAAAFLACAGCSTTAIVADKFQSTETCPRDHFTVHRREDLLAHDLVCRTTDETAHLSLGSDLEGDHLDCNPVPPRGQGENGVRYRMWRAGVAARIERFDETFGEIYEARGCGAVKFYGCVGDGYCRLLATGS